MTFCKLHALKHQYFSANSRKIVLGVILITCSVDNYKLSNVIISNVIKDLGGISIGLAKVAAVKHHHEKKEEKKDAKEQAKEQEKK